MFNQRKHLMKITMESLGFTDAQIQGKHIFINESLTATNRYILKYAHYKLKKNSNFKFIWSKNGRTMARKDEDVKVVTLKSKEDVDKLFNSVQH